MYSKYYISKYINIYSYAAADALISGVQKKKKHKSYFHQFTTPSAVCAALELNLAHCIGLYCVGSSVINNWLFCGLIA